MPSLISIPTPAAPQTPAVDSASRIPRVSSYCYKNFFNFSRKYHENTH